MKHLFIINPAAGSRDRSDTYRKQIEEICQLHELDHRIEVSAAPGNCTEIARQAAQSGEEYRIYACGGDGTLNEVVAGVAGYDNVAVTMFCCGSGNDFVKIFSDTAPFRDLEQLLDCKEAKFDLVRCNEDISLNICSVGLDARIGTDVSNYKRIPLLSGFRAYVASTVVNVIRGISEHYVEAYVASTVVNVIRGISEHYVVQINGEQFDSEYTMICACNGRFYGGGFNPVPEADPADGLLDVLLVEKVNCLQVAQVIGKYKNGQYKKLPKLVRHFKTDKLRIICDKPSSINLDGELRTAQVVDISIAPEKLRFFYPAQLTWQHSEEACCT